MPPSSSRTGRTRTTSGPRDRGRRPPLPAPVRSPPIRALERPAANPPTRRRALPGRRAPVREGLREPRVYFSILRAICGGATRLSQIADQVQGPNGGASLSSYVATLQELGLTEYRRRGRRERAARDLGRRRSVPPLLVPFRAAEPGPAGARRQRRARVSDRRRTVLDHFVSKPTFEDICRAWMLDQSQARRLAGHRPRRGLVGAGPTRAPASCAGRPRARRVVAGRRPARAWPVRND